jgi:hypothetical protein
MMAGSARHGAETGATGAYAPAGHPSVAAERGELRLVQRGGDGAEPVRVKAVVPVLSVVAERTASDGAPVLAA